MRNLTIGGQSNVFKTLAASKTICYVLATNLLIEFINKVNKVKIFRLMKSQN